MPLVSAAKIAAEAEAVRWEALAKRQGSRAAFGIGAAVFALGLLALINVTAYFLLRSVMQPVFASVIVLLVDLAVAAGLGVFALRSGPTQAEQDALEVRQRALHELEGAIAMSALLPVAGSLSGSGWRAARSGRQTTAPGKRRFRWRR